MNDLLKEFNSTQISLAPSIVTAKSVAEKLGIEEFYGEVKPADKLALVDIFKVANASGVLFLIGSDTEIKPAIRPFTAKYMTLAPVVRSSSACVPSEAV